MPRSQLRVSRTRRPEDHPQLPFLTSDLARSTLLSTDLPGCAPTSFKEATAAMGGTEGLYTRGGYLIPFYSEDRQPIPGFKRLRANDGSATVRLPQGKRSRPPKYVQPANSINHLYLCPVVDWLTIVEDVTVDLDIHEGEKKAALSCKHGRKAVGTTGKDSWDTPEYRRIRWRGRRVRLVPDSDYRHNEDVRRSWEKLADDLEAKGAQVSIYVPPDIEQGKTGSDDQVATRGWDEYEKALLSVPVRPSSVPAHVDLDAADNLPEEPLLTGIPKKAMYGRARKIADELEVPISYAYPAVLTAIAPVLEPPVDKNVWTALYTLLIGGVGKAKSVTRKRANGLVAVHLGDRLRKNVPASDRGIFELFSPPRVKPDGSNAKPVEHKPEIVQPDRFSNSALSGQLLSLDEARLLLEKATIKNSGLMYVLNELFNEPDSGTAVKGGLNTVSRLRLSILGCVKVKDANEFPEIFGEAMTHGFYDRCLLAVPGIQEADGWIFSPQEVKPLSTKNKFSKPVVLPHVWETTADWVRSVEDDEQRQRRGRLREIGIRVAYITSAINGDTEVKPEAVRAALAFMEWQERIRALYHPATGRDKSAECTAAILDFFQKAPGYAANFAKTASFYNWYRRFGADTVARIRRNLEYEGVLREDRTRHVHYLAQRDDAAKNNGHKAIDAAFLHKYVREYLATAAKAEAKTHSEVQIDRSPTAIAALLYKDTGLTATAADIQSALTAVGRSA